jgi:hypothetical protein
MSRVQKEINTIEKQRTACFAALKTATFSEKHEDKFGLASSIRARAIKSLHKYSSYKLEKLQLQKENFESLKKSLPLKMKLGEVKQKKTASIEAVYICNLLELLFKN